MASKFPAELEEKAQLRTRKGHDITWSCDKHGEPIKFYCKVHEIAICHPCATKDHVKKQCDLDDIEDVILKRGKELDEKLVEIEEARKRLKRLDSEVQPCANLATNHLQSVNDEINATYEGKLKSLKDQEQKEIRLINEEADEEIRIIIEKRDKRIKACNEEAEKQQQIIEEKQASLMSQTKTIKDVVDKKIANLKSKNRYAIDSIDNMSCKITRIKQDDKTLVNEAPQVIASLDESLSANVHRDVVDCLARIQEEVQKVKFVEGEVGGGHYARIDGYIGKWERVKSIDIPSIVSNPLVCGLICDDKICVIDRSNKACYVINLSSELIEKVIKANSDMYITSCATIDSNVIVCGKWRRVCTGGRLDGCITLYDRQWKVIRDITIPRNEFIHNKVYVDVDRDGMFLAAEYFQSNIYVINPADGKIVNTITMQGKMVWYGIQALSSGDIVVRTGMNEFTVISRSGEEKAVIHYNEWAWSCYSDKLTDTLYITYWDKKGRYVVDQVSRDGNIQARRIVEYVKSDRSTYESLCLVTPSGNLVACNGDKLFLYKKSFIV